MRHKPPTDRHRRAAPASIQSATARLPSRWVAYVVELEVMSGTGENFFSFMIAPTERATLEPSGHVIDNARPTDHCQFKETPAT